MTQAEPPHAYIFWSKNEMKLQGQLQGQLPGRFYAFKMTVISQKYPPL